MPAPRCYIPRIVTNGATGPIMPAKIELSSPLLRRLRDHWTGLLPDGARASAIPPVRALDPIEIRWALGAISLVDVAGAPPDCAFRYALDGSWQVERYGVDMTGKSLDEFPEPETRALIRASYLEVVAARAPFARRRDLMLDGRHRRYEALLLPFGTDARVERLAVALDFEHGGS
jgi:hypothetical protein